MKEVCFPLTSKSNLCKRKIIIDELKKLVKDVERDDKPPICRAAKKEEEKKSEGERCYCGSTPGEHHQHVMVDGKLAKSVVSEPEIIRIKKWCPPCVHIKPLSNQIHNCYRVHGVAPRNGMPPEVSRCAGDCSRPVQEVNAEGDLQGIQAVVDLQGIQDDVFGGQSCPYEHPSPTRGHYYCPAGDPWHVHWSPPTTRQCRYPNTCVASCFQHPAVSDWIYKQPKYRCYLQNTVDKPF